MFGIGGIEPGTGSLFSLAGPWHILEVADRNFLRITSGPCLALDLG